MGCMGIFLLLFSCFSPASPMLEVFMGYSRGIHGVFICIGYVSVMYRLCIGNVTEEKSSEGVNKEDNESNKHPCAGAQKSKLSKP